MRRLLVGFLLTASVAAAQGTPTPFDEPVVETVADAARIVAAVREADEHVFYVTPTFRSQALADELARLTGRVDVYVVVAGGRADLAAPLVAQGVQVRTLPRLAEGLLLIDYTELFVGGILTGLGDSATFVDLEAYGNDVMVQQLRGLWQAATPYGQEP